MCIVLVFYTTTSRPQHCLPHRDDVRLFSCCIMCIAKRSLEKNHAPKIPEFSSAGSWREEVATVQNCTVGNVELTRHPISWCHSSLMLWLILFKLQLSTVLYRIDLLFSWSVFDSTFILLEHCAIRIYFHLYWFVWCSLCHALTCRWLSLHNFVKNMHLHVKLFLIPCFFVRKIG